MDSQNPGSLTADELIARAMQAAGLDPATIGTGSAQDTDEVLIQAMQAAGLDPTTIGTGGAPDAEIDAVAEDTAAATVDETNRDDITLALTDILPDGRF